MGSLGSNLVMKVVRARYKNSVLIRRGRELVPPLSALWGHRGKTAVYKPGSEHSSDTTSASSLRWDFSVSITVRNKIFLFSHPVYGIFVIAVQAD